MYTGISLTVEFIPGTTIKEAYKQASKLANRINVSIKFIFNGIDCIASPEGDIEKGIKMYYNALDSELKLALD